MSHIMLDLETMGTGPDAAIVAIGAVEFYPDSFDYGKTFYHTINLQSSVDEGGVIDPATVIWWMQRDEDARKQILNPDTTIRSALLDFSSWLNSNFFQKRIWGNGVAFDNIILRSAYQRSGIKVPWEYQEDRCYRTIRSMYPDVEIERETPHHALEDAKLQAKHLVSIVQKYKLQID